MTTIHSDLEPRPLVYFDRNGGEYPWFLRESDGTESSHELLADAVMEGIKCVG